MIQVTKGETELHAGRRAHLIWDDSVSRKVSGIYKITSPTGRIYIGQARNIYRRFRQYMLYCNLPRQTSLYRSFDKYGIEKHSHELVQVFDFYNKTLLNDLEKHYIRLSCSFSDWNSDESKKGLNLTTGGDNEAISSTITLKKRSLATKGVLKPNHWYKPTEAHKQAIRNGILGIKRIKDELFYEKYAARRKQVHRFNAEGEYLDSFDFANCPKLKSLGFHKVGVNKCCTGKVYVYKEHLFSYDKEFKPSQAHLDSKFRIKIYQYTLEGLFMREYPSMRSLRLEGFKFTTIRNGLIKKEQHTYKGFIFSKMQPQEQMMPQ